MQRQLQLPLAKLDVATRGGGRQRAKPGTSRSGRPHRVHAHPSRGGSRGPFAPRPRHSRPDHGDLEDWRIDHDTRVTGRRGLAVARAALAGTRSGGTRPGPATRAA
ncbi:MAG: hypothetical protein ABSC00_07660 [Acidimicrobiales bacterium]